MLHGWRSARLTMLAGSVRGVVSGGGVQADATPDPGEPNIWCSRHIGDIHCWRRVLCWRTAARYDAGGGLVRHRRVHD